MWARRRAEIVEDFDREVLGRVPKNVPKVTWSVTRTVESTVGGRPVIGRQLVGHVDNSASPGDHGGHPDDAGDAGGRQDARARDDHVRRRTHAARQIRRRPRGPACRAFTPPPSADPPATEQLIADGWGYASLNPGSVQADNGAGLTSGIIGLVNKGARRKPDDWGALRAWAWGASRALDYLETDKSVDAKKVGIEGVSRYGKAALVTMAFDTRFAVVLVGSSGEGGAKPHRRNFGEAVENLTGSGEYHWMAGNFLKYGAAEATFGSKNAGDIPVDSHQLIALCAPRATFISYGIPEKGDAKWLDQQGSYMATIAAGAVFRLLGAKDLGRGDDYRTAKMPPVNDGPARRAPGVAPARRRAHGRPELEVLHPVGGPAPAPRAGPVRRSGKVTGQAQARRVAAWRPSGRHHRLRLQEPNDHERAIVLRGARFRESRHLRHDPLADSLGRARRGLRGDREDAVVSELLFRLVFGLVDAIRVDNQRVAGRDLPPAAAVLRVGQDPEHRAALIQTLRRAPRNRVRPQQQWGSMPGVHVAQCRCRRIEHAPEQGHESFGRGLLAQHPVDPFARLLVL